jgi:hypothetical protein
MLMVLAGMADWTDSAMLTGLVGGGESRLKLLPPAGQYGPAMQERAADPPARRTAPGGSMPLFEQNQLLSLQYFPINPQAHEVDAW